jgi:hypothetical protein
MSVTISTGFFMNKTLPDFPIATTPGLWASLLVGDNRRARKRAPSVRLGLGILSAVGMFHQFRLTDRLQNGGEV